MKALDHIANKFNIEFKISSEMPIMIPGGKRQDLATLYAELGYNKGVEVGVERGFFSEQICQENPGAKLYCVDAWEMYAQNDGYRSQGQLNRYYSQAQERLAPYNCELVKRWSLDAAKDFDRESIDFVFLDANHIFDYLINDIIEWSRVIRPGGIVSGHDYVSDSVSHTYRYGVIEATNAYAKAHDISPWFVLASERSASWFWIKP